MIVKNEAHIIKECLECVYKYIKGYVICDTGSTDGTQKVIKDFFDSKGISGEIYDRPWKNFGHNRSEALRYCDGKKGYAWVIDADDRVNGNLVFPKKMTHDGYMLRLQDGETVYYTVQIFKIASKWKYEAVLHEYPVCTKYQKGDGTEHEDMQRLLTGVSKKPGQKMAMIEGDYYIESRRLGDRSKNPLKYHKDAEVLQAEVDRDPKNTRNWFYLAQSYNCAGEKDKAIECYRKRTTLLGYLEEVFFSYLSIANILQSQNKSDDEVLAAYLKAGKYDPERIEPWYELMLRYRNKEKYLESLKWAERGLKSRYGERMLFTKRSLYEYGLQIEYAICLKLLNRYDEAIKIFKSIIEAKVTPEEQKDRCKKLIVECENIKSIEDIKTSNKPVICFFTGYMNPYNQVTSYGSELALRELCKVLEKTYNIFIFTDSDTQGCPPNVMRGSLMESFCLSVPVQCMIVWRYCYYFVQYDVRVDNHIMWIHDVCIHGGYNGQNLPGNGFEVIKRFDHMISHYITLSDSHRESILSQYGMSPDKVVNIGNGIVVSPSLSLQRKPKRFIWSSAPYRGLDYVLKIWPKIIERWPSSELHVFRGPEEFKDDLLSKVRSTAGVSFHGKISQQTLSLEFQTSDIWLYPTNFVETFCMSGLEALLGGCLCIYSKIGALPEVVGKYGWELSETIQGDKMTDEILSLLDKIFSLPDNEVKERREKAISYAKSLSWNERGEQWIKVFQSVESKKIPIDIDSSYKREQLVKYLPRCCNLVLRPEGKKVSIDRKGGDINLSFDPPSKRIQKSAIERSVYLYKLSPTLDQVKRMQNVKEKTLSVFLSSNDQTICKFVNGFGKTLKNGRIDGKYSYDVFSTDNTIINYRAGVSDSVKDFALSRYRYTMVIESSTEKNYLTDKIGDAILMGCLPFYHGCSNMEQFIDPRAFIRIDLNDPEKSYEIIRKSIEAQEYNRRLQYITSSRKRILTMMLFPTIERIIVGRQFPELTSYIIEGYGQLDDFENNMALVGYERYQRFDKVTSDNISEWMSKVSHVCSGKESSDEVLRSFSHYSLWEAIANGEDEYVVVFEDRIRLSELFCYNWSRIYNEASRDPKWDCIYFTEDSSAYCIRKSGAKKLISEGPIDCSLFDFMSTRINGQMVKIVHTEKSGVFCLYKEPTISFEPYTEKVEENIHLLSYLQKETESSFDDVKKRGKFASIVLYDETSIQSQPSYADFSRVFAKRPQANAWRPSIIFDRLAHIPENSILLYCDPVVKINMDKIEELRTYIDKMEAMDMCVFQGDEQEYKMTCGGVFDHFRIRNSHIVCLTGQITSRVFLIRNTPSAKKFLQDWFMMLGDEKMHDMGNNMTGFVQHNNDQSIFSVLCKISAKTVKIEDNLKGDGVFVLE